MFKEQNSKTTALRDEDNQPLWRALAERGAQKEFGNAPLEF